MEENFVEISGKVSVWNGSGEVIEFYPEERGRLDAGHQGTTPPPPLFTEMPFVFEGDPARPRVRTIHVLWDDLIDGKGTIQIQARVKYQSFLPASFLKGPRRTAGSFGYQASWEFSYTTGQDRVEAMAPEAPLEVGRHEEESYEGPTLECYRLDQGNVKPTMAFFRMWLKLLPPPDASSEPISIGLPVVPVSGKVGGVTARQREGPAFTVQLYIFGRPPVVPDTLLSPDFIYFPVLGDDPNPTEWNKIYHWRTDLQNFRSGLPERAYLYEHIVAGKVSVYVQGCASTPGRDKINIPLSQRRANNVEIQLKRYFGDDIGVIPKGVSSSHAQAQGRNFSGDIFAKIWIEREDAEEIVQSH